MDDHDDQPPAEESAPATAACPMCRRTVPAKEIVVLAGRTLCLGCATAWFDEDEE